MRVNKSADDEVKVVLLDIIDEIDEKYFDFNDDDICGAINFLPQRSSTPLPKADETAEELSTEDFVRAVIDDTTLSIDWCNADTVALDASMDNLPVNLTFMGSEVELNSNNIEIFNDSIEEALNQGFYISINGEYTWIARNSI